jgi:ParB-like chromosome segregation protein Spo0J
MGSAPGDWTLTASLAEFDQLPVLMVPLNSLVPADSPRQAGVDAAHARVLAEVPPGRLPPILVHRPTSRIIDGMHRLHAVSLRGDDTIRARLVDCSEERAFILAIELNISHGLPLSLADRGAAAARIVAAHPDWSDRAIGLVAGLSAKTVAGLRDRYPGHSPEVSTRIGRDGRVRPVNGAEGRRRASEVITARPSATLREIAKDAGVSLGTARDVRDRVRRGEDPLPARQRAAERSAAEQRAAGRSAVSSGRAGLAAPSRNQNGHRKKSVTGLAAWPLIQDRLGRDPAIRYALSGRTFLRWMESHLTGLDEWRNFIDCIPAHWSDNVEALASSCSDEWRNLARELEERRKLYDSGDADRVTG